MIIFSSGGVSGEFKTLAQMKEENLGMGDKVNLSTFVFYISAFIVLMFRGSYLRRTAQRLAMG